MLFERIYDDDLAQASYLIGCQQTGTAVVVDPRRDIEVFLAAAERNGMTIESVVDTHIHADYLSGARELARRTGAVLYLSSEGGEEWQYRFEHQGLADGDVITLGNVRIEASHTPGHTPEHLSLLVTDGATSDRPGYLLSGDFVFVGDLGRPDLLDEAAGEEDTRFEMAPLLYASLRDRFIPLADYVQVWPGHGAGSACGKSLGAVASSTVGYEKLTAWWSTYLRSGDEPGFVDALLEGQPDAPVYFGRMKRQNRDGPALLGELAPLPHLEPSQLTGHLERGGVFVDTRAHDQFKRAHLPGSLNVPGGGKFATRAAWVLDPELMEHGVVLLAANQQQADGLRARLLRVGIDDVRGFVPSLEGLELRQFPTVVPSRLSEIENPFILDIRTASEYEEGHIPGATRIHGGQVMWRLSELPKDRPIVIHCRSGSRSAPVASALRSRGFDNLIELEGSFDRWQREQREVVRG